MTKVARPLVVLVVFLLSFLVMFHDTLNRFEVIEETVRNKEGLTVPREIISRAHELFYASYAFHGERLRHHQFSGTEDLHDRHKLRWFYRTAETRFYQAVARNFDFRMAGYARMAHYAAWMTIAFFFIWRAILYLQPSADLRHMVILATAFYAYVSYVVWAPMMGETFSIVEMGCVAAALDMVLRRHLLGFIAALAVAVSNRESSLIIGTFYPLINWDPKDWKKMLVALAAGPLVLVGLNLDAFADPNFYRPSTYVAVHLDRINIFNMPSYPTTTGVMVVIKTGLAALPFVAALLFGFRQAGTRGLSLAGALFLPVLLFGTYLGNVLPFLITLPFTLVLGFHLYLADGPLPAIVPPRGTNS